MIPQTPFAQATFELMGKVLPKGGATQQGLIYDDKKTTYRTEVDQALRAEPDMIFAAGYTPDTIVLLKDIYRAGFKGKIIGFGYSINQKLLDQIGQPEVVEGVYTYSPSPAEGSGAYEKVKAAVGSANPDPYTCQVYDHVNLVLLAIANAKAATGRRSRTISASRPRAAASRSTTRSTASRRSPPARRSTTRAPRARATSTTRATSSTASSATTRSRPASSPW